MKPCQVGSVNWSGSPSGFFESRVRTWVLVKATSTQLLYVELRVLFFQVRSSAGTAHSFGSRASRSAREAINAADSVVGSARQRSCASTSFASVTYWGSSR